MSKSILKWKSRWESFTQIKVKWKNKYIKLDAFSFSWANQIRNRRWQQQRIIQAIANKIKHVMRSIRRRMEWETIVMLIIIGINILLCPMRFQQIKILLMIILINVDYFFYLLPLFSYESSYKVMKIYFDDRAWISALIFE